jgi:hypothetical protein
MRSEIVALKERGRLPMESSAVTDPELAEWSNLVTAIAAGPPPDRAELEVLFRSYPDDGDLAFGLAWAVLHFVERGEDVASAEAFVNALPDTVPTSREWMETFTIRQLNVERNRDLLIATARRARPEARAALVDLIRGIASVPGDAVAERAALALVELT